MAKLAFSELSNQIDMLSYAERIRLLDKIVRTLHAPMKVPAKKNCRLCCCVRLMERQGCVFGINPRKGMGALIMRYLCSSSSSRKVTDCLFPTYCWYD